MGAGAIGAAAIAPAAAGAWVAANRNMPPMMNVSQARREWFSCCDGPLAASADR
jgi:hypothetical protein